MSSQLTFHERLARERKRIRLTQAQFAAACGVRLGAQYLYEKGSRSPTAVYLRKAKALGVNTEYVLGDDMPVPNELGLLITADKVLALYRQVDDLSRDQEGRLFDLGERLALLRRLIEQH